MAAIGDFLRRAWLPLTTLVVVAGLTALAVRLRAGDEVPTGGQVEQASAGDRTGGPRGGGQTGRGGRSTTGESLPRDARTWPWWRDDEVKRELGLTEEKSAEIEQIYRARAERMRPFADAFLAEEALLNRMVRERTASREELEIQASKMESLRADVLTSRWVMLYRLYTELEPDQYQMLLDIRDRRFNRGRGGTNR